MRRPHASEKEILLEACHNTYTRMTCMNEHVRKKDVFKSNGKQLKEMTWIESSRRRNLKVPRGTRNGLKLSPTLVCKERANFSTAKFSFERLERV